MSARLAPAVLAAKAAGALARRAGRGGTSLPGKLLLRLEPGALGELAGRLPGGSIAVSATNGKTTSAAMIASVLQRTGTTLVHNRAGANMAGGVASALLGAARRGGRMTGTHGLFEVDEFWLDRLVDELDPRALLLGNLFRDQLDRYGELETIADRWAGVAAARAGRTELVLNADDPLIADLGRDTAADPERPRPGVTYFGVDDDGLALPGVPHAADSKHCRRCGHAYVYEAVYLAHLGHYRCPNCGARRPEPRVTATDVRLNGVRDARFRLTAPAGTADVRLPLPGLYNVYNALGAAALCLALGIELREVVAGLESVSPAFGRAETVEVGGRPVCILLVKNPAGANEVLRTLTLEDGPDGLDVWGVLNDNIADGRDVSWVWDADFEVLAPRLRRMTCSGTRAGELAVRLKYAGADPARLHVVPDVAEGLDAAVAGGGDADAPLYALPTYTALLSLRDLLSERGLAARYWA